MKILLICEAVFPENKGGLERWMSWLGLQLANRGFTVDYINASGVNDVRDGVKYVSVNKENWHYVSDGKRSIKQSIGFAFAIRPLIRKIKPDVIYSVQAPIFSIFSLVLWPNRRWMLIVEWIEIWSLKYWQSYLGIFSGSIGFILQYFATKCADIRVVFSDRCLSQLGASNERNVLLPGLHMAQTPLEITKNRSRNDVLYLGRFVAEKQPLLALEAVFELRKLGWNGIFHIIGSGPLASQIRKAINEKAMSDYVTLFENAPQIKLEECFEKSFVLIHPSRREGYGLAMIEAAERGIPTILIDYPENASVDLKISPNLICSDENPVALAALMFQAWSNQEENLDELRNWAAKILPRMSASKSVDKLISVIESGIHRV